MKILFLSVCVIVSSLIGYTQEFEMELLTDTILTGLADPEIPIIFHFDAVNLGDETYLVDMFREETDVPNGWEISLCTEACFPPEVTEAVFFLDEMATDEVSVYFYASSVGSGMTRVRFINTQDSSNSFEYNLFVNTEPLGISDFELNSFNASYDALSQSIKIDVTNESSNKVVAIYNVLGSEMDRRILNGQSTTIETNDWAKGIYVVSLQNDATVKIVVD
ncbi:MAG: hypothetical protein ACI8XB_001242 [Patiriisocius sp.]